jgi:hypothetical protein
VTDTNVITEEGLLLTHEQAIDAMPWLDNPKRLFACGLDLTPFLRKVVDHWEATGDYFNLMAQPFFKESFDKRQRRVVSVRANYFGFRPVPKRAYQQIHYLFDPLLFLSDSASAVTGLYDSCNDPYRLLQLVKAYRKVCQTLNVPMQPSASAFGSMMLRHPKFFPEARAKVSLYTNKVAAQAKIGQHEWKAPATRSKRTIVMQLDQRRAHHTCASTMSFPHSNYLRLRGNYRTLTGEWRDIADFRNQHGVLYVNVTIPETPPSGVPTFPELEQAGTFNYWIGTNEVTAWQSCGARINHVITAIATNKIDPGLSKYAEYAKTHLNDHHTPHVATFIKMLYFRPYGLLGMRPTKPERYYLHCNGEHNCNVRDEHLGQGLILPLHIHADKYEKEASYVNQVWRAMLEREARKRVIMEARRLHFDHDKRIVGIYADSIYVKWPYLIEADESVWKAKKHEVSFIGRNVYEHDTGKLIAPGVAGTPRQEIIAQALTLPLELDE